MSVLPLLFDDSFCYRPSRLLDQHFGVVLDPEDFLQPFIAPISRRCPSGYIRNWNPAAAARDGGSVVTCDKTHFKADLDVQQFKPDDITVKVSDNIVTIEAKHEEKQDQHGQIFRHFIRKYNLPKDCDMDKVESKLSSDGVLTVTAPRLGDNQSHKVIPITQTGEPARAIKPETAVAAATVDNKCDGDKQ